MRFISIYFKFISDLFHSDFTDTVFPTWIFEGNAHSDPTGCSEGCSAPYTQGLGTSVFQFQLKVREEPDLAL